MMGPLLAGGPLISFLAQVHGNWRLALATIRVFGVVLTFLSLLIVKNKPRSQEILVYLKRSKKFLNACFISKLENLVYYFLFSKFLFISFYSWCYLGY